MRLIGAALGRISVSRKLLLIYGLDLVTVAFLAYTVAQEAYISIDFARKEQIGNTYMAVVRASLFDALSFVAAPDSGAARRSLTDDLDVLDSVDARLGAALETPELKNQTAAALRALMAAPDDPSQALERVIDAERALFQRVGDSSNLILDPDLDSYYSMSLILLRLPELIESLALLDAKIRSVTRDGRIDAEEHGALVTLRVRLATVIQGIAGDLDAGFRGNEDGSLRRALEVPFGDLVGANSLVLEDLDDLTGNGDFDPAGVEPARKAIADMYRVTQIAWRDSAQELARLLDLRIAGFFHRMYQHFELAGGLLAFILFAVLLVANGIARPITHLAEVADRVRLTNDYSLRARWRSFDEPGRLVLAFNTMLERLQSEGQRRQELAARASAAEAQRDLIETIPTPLVVVRIADHHMLHLNQPAVDLLGLAPGEQFEAAGSLWLAVDDRQRLLDTAVERGFVNEFEALCRTAAGGAIWALMSARLLRFHNEPAVLITMVSITERHRMEEELRAAKDAAERALVDLQQTQQSLIQAEKLASLGGLVAGVAHEINTPVGIGLTGASVLATETDRIAKLYQGDLMQQEHFEAYLDTARETAALLVSNMNRAAGLIQSFKQVAVDQVSAERRRFKLKDYIDEILTSLQPSLRKPLLEIIVDCPPDLQIDSFPGALSQVLTNLVMNAVIHAFDETGRGRIEIVVDQPNEREVRLRFRDNGVGIPADSLGRIFDPFFTTKRGAGGSGLGLHIVYNIITGTLNGRVEVTSEPGVGTQFALHFPKIAAPSAGVA